MVFSTPSSSVSNNPLILPPTLPQAQQTPSSEMATIASQAIQSGQIYKAKSLDNFSADLLPSDKQADLSLITSLFSSRTTDRLPALQIVKSWNSAEGTVILARDSKEELQAYVQKNGQIAQVSAEWIVGIPKEIRKDARKLASYLEDTYIHLSPLEGGYKLYINPRLRGGGNGDGSSSSSSAPAADRLDKEVIDLIKGAIEHAKKAREKDIIALIGNTGTGKSTAVNHLLGIQMKWVRERGGGNIQAANPEEEIAKIGHRPATSETLYAHVYEKPGEPLIFADCGGFFDTRGVNQDIGVVTSLKLTLENARSVKLVLCFDSSTIQTDRAIHFSQAVNLALGTLLKDYKKYGNSILILFTKPKADPSGRMFDSQVAYELLEEIMNDLHEGPQKEFYKFLLRDNGKYLCVCNPLSPASREENRHILSQMGSIQNPQNAFQPAYSAHSQLKLLEEMTAIAVGGSELYTRYFYNREAIEGYEKEIANLTAKITSIRASIQTLGNGENDPDAIKAAEQTIIEQNKDLAKQQEDNIKLLEGKIEEIKAKIEAIQAKIDLLDKKGEEEEEYWKDRIDQEGINIESKTTIIETNKRSGFLGFGGGSSRKETVTSTVDKREIHRDFNYRGPEIARIEKDPAEGNCWSEENQTANSYSIHYTTGKGEAARASVKVFVKNKHLPEHLTQRGGYAQEIATEQAEINKCNLDIAEDQKRIHQAEKAITAKGTVLEKLAQYKKSVEELEDSKKDLEEKLHARQKENTEVEEKIQGQKEEFEFLKDYLELSRDNQLKAKEIIAKFLSQDKEYAEVGNA
ncbi:GTPase domain-containing protein [Parachlamydia sp. AcF125]|uniref:GTPase domain-containing protein n=1 Tax=Parachlamydia sp. AcF125 TaxID=2795736 RepID=UPI001BC9E546|nr:GTPase domain-containing protein [Parachlamydia sp. AcF125]MBS4167768.1 hypothetical protein [Parachlamydia sp. AcF125]